MVRGLLMIGVGATVGLFTLRSSFVAPHTRATVGVHPGGMAPGRIVAEYSPQPGNRMAAFSGGCFWGAEDAFRHTPGVVATAVGYMGGTSAFPTYEVAHRTGHAETVLVEYSPAKVSYARLLATFGKLPHPGKHSFIWTFDTSQAREAEVAAFKNVRIKPRSAFYLAEDYHQQYDEKSGTLSCNSPEFRNAPRS